MKNDQFPTFGERRINRHEADQTKGIASMKKRTKA
jgi:hypothetical protein